MGRRSGLGNLDAVVAAASVAIVWEAREMFLWEGEVVKLGFQDSWRELLFPIHSGISDKRAAV